MDAIEEIAKCFPLRRIMNEEGPYLDRYTLESKVVHWECPGPHACSSTTGRNGRRVERVSRDELFPRDCGYCQSFVYLHHFLASDAVTDVHDHPWDARVTILSGSYREHRASENPSDDHETTVYTRSAGDVFDLKSTTKHRVELFDSLTSGVSDVWTLCEVGPRLKSWGFTNIATGAYTPWREALKSRGLL